MKVVHISTSVGGGAGIATTRLHNALLHHGIESSLLTKQKVRDDIPKHFQFNRRQNYLNRAFKKLGINDDVNKASAEKHLANRPKGYEYFSFPFSEIDVTKHWAVQQADIVHLHWVSDFFLDFPSFFKKIDKPIVWTLHDMNPFTGGCHHADDCRGFMQSCLDCPQLKGTIDDSYAARVLSIKFNAINELDKNKLKIVAPSDWLLNQSLHSILLSLFEHHRIRNVVDTGNFKIRDRAECRTQLNLPCDKKLVMFTAKDIDNPRKGIWFLERAMEQLGDVVVCGVGKNYSHHKFKNFIDMGFISDSKHLSEIYNAVDVFVLPSLAENFPNTICESLLCGTPVVAFDIGGIPELINEENGRLALYRNVNSLADAINEVLNNNEKFNAEKISATALNEFNPSNVVNDYFELYKSFGSA